MKPRLRQHNLHVRSERASAQRRLNRKCLPVIDGGWRGRDCRTSGRGHVRGREDLDAVFGRVGGVLELLLVEGGGVAVVGEMGPAGDVSIIG